MRLNHVNLVVGDLDEAQNFFRRSFDLKLVDRKADAVVVMNDAEGFTLVLGNARAFGRETPVRYPKGFHVGFILAACEDVDRTHERLVASGEAIGRGPRTIRGESYGFYFEALDGILFEVSCPM